MVKFCVEIWEMSVSVSERDREVECESESECISRNAVRISELRGQKDIRDCHPLCLENTFIENCIENTMQKYLHTYSHINTHIHFQKKTKNSNKSVTQKQLYNDSKEEI